MDPKTVRTAMHDDGLKSYTSTPRHRLTEENYGSTVKIFSGEQLFPEDANLNGRNDRYLSETIADVKGTFRTKNPVKVMVLGVVVSDRKKMPPYFFKLRERWVMMSTTWSLGITSCHGSRITTKRANMWTQDSAPCHTANKVQKFCKANFADF